MLDRIIEQTDGIPLFIEELTKSILETTPDGTSVPSIVPATLQASLMARLDQLGPAAKEVAQTGAAIGREFGQELLSSVTDLPGPQCLEALKRLTNAGLLFVRGTSPDASYIFKHALVQDAAYGALVRNRRQLLHTRIATTLEDRFPDIVLAQPALLAQHHAEAGLVEKAIVYWLRAGQQSLRKSTMREAAALLRKGLDVLTTLPDGQWRQQQELDLQTALGAALGASKGWSAKEIDKTYSRAQALAEWLDRPEYLVPLIVTRCNFHLARAEYGLTLAGGFRLEQFGDTRGDVDAQLQGRRMQGQARLYLGDFLGARAVLERCMGLADPLFRDRISNDCYAHVLAYLALALGFLGYIDQARSRMDQALSHARHVGQAHNLAGVLIFANWLDWITRSPIRHVEEALALSAEHDLPFYLGRALAYRGRSLISLGQAQEGLAALEQGLEEMSATGGAINNAMVLTWFAEAYALLGQSAEQQNCLAEAAQIVTATDERVSAAELLHRIPGDLLNATGDHSDAERHYRQAIAAAERQSAKLFQLRASTSLARLWRDQGRRVEAHDLLSPIYYWFTEGFDAPDLKDAKALLDEPA